MGINCLFNSKPLLNCEDVIREREREREKGGGGGTKSMQNLKQELAADQLEEIKNGGSRFQWSRPELPAERRGGHVPLKQTGVLVMREGERRMKGPNKWLFPLPFYRFALFRSKGLFQAIRTYCGLQGASHARRADRRAVPRNRPQRHKQIDPSLTLLSFFSFMFFAYWFSSNLQSKLYHKFSWFKFLLSAPMLQKKRFVHHFLRLKKTKQNFF